MYSVINSVMESEIFVNSNCGGYFWQNKRIADSRALLIETILEVKNILG